MYIRKDPLKTGEVYHVFNKSIAGFKIFNNKSELSRMLATIRYYQMNRPPDKFSRFMRSDFRKENFHDKIVLLSGKQKIIGLIAYCFMPTHFHLILKQLKDDGVSKIMGNALNSYTRYFNIKHNRKGPLWQGRFKNVLVKTDEQLLHLTRYIHLNPVTAYLCKKPEEWGASSYHEYIRSAENRIRICDFDDVLDIEPNSYRKFVVDLIDYQKKLATIKHLIFE